MRNKALGFILGWCVVVSILALALFFPGMAGAVLQATPTSSGFMIPTSTAASSSGLGGLVIPTSTPAESGGAALPPLTAPQLQALGLQPGDVPADFAAQPQVETFVADEMVAAIRAQGYAETADQLQQIVTTYGWDQSIGTTYSACVPTLPVNEIYSEIGQLGSPDAARRFYDDAQVQAFFGALGYTIAPAQNAHGWRVTLPVGTPTCFAQEIEYGLYVEYWGLMIMVTITADANTDPAMINGLLDQLLLVIIARADALPTTPFSPTPVPGLSAQPPAALPTQVALPLPTLPATLASIEALLPTQQELGLPASFALNQSLSGSFTQDQIVGMFQNLNLTELANATAQAAARDGLIGMVSRVWDTGSQCPTDVNGLSVEIDVNLFESAQGAAAHIKDAAIQQAWLNTGAISDFQTLEKGAVLASGSYQHPCGLVTLYNLLVPHGRFVVTVSAIGWAEADQQELLETMVTLDGYMIQKLDQAELH
ncbi:MAG: hypothetical protein HY866_18250 [Chloroflexi bacterium]|nr:hypothetical protein [Chloroflexota bacterium]